jgi:hypothetical protein
MHDVLNDNSAFSVTLKAVQDAGEDFEWYPTTGRMIEVVAKRITATHVSIMDIGAGDGRVLAELGKRLESTELYAIEKSTVLVQAQPECVIPVGTDLFEQNLACLPVDYIFCNPPYSQYETWASAIIDSGYAKRAFLIIPQRWAKSEAIAGSLKRRGAKAKAIHTDDFLDAERRARAVVNIVEIDFPRKENNYHDEPADPFDIWFDQNISTFDHADESDVSEYEQERRELAKIRHLKTIPEMVDAYNEEYARMEENYRAIFKLDYALLKELGVDKEHVREGIKKKMAGLKNKYWNHLFDQLDAITKRLSSETKKRFLKKLTGRATVAFTANNIYAVVLWAIKNANRYYDEQLVKLFRDLSTHDGVMNYKSNQRTWQKDGWRYAGERENPNTHYALDYRIVKQHYSAIPTADRFGFTSSYDSPANLHRTCHDLIADITAVLYNLGFSTDSPTSYERSWESNQWQDFLASDDRVLFQVKAFKNGNLHFRFMPEAIKALNVEAGRLLGWIRGREDVIAELGYTPEEASRYFGSILKLGPTNVKLLTGEVPDASRPQ